MARDAATRSLEAATEAPQSEGKSHARRGRIRSESDFVGEPEDRRHRGLQAQQPDGQGFHLGFGRMGMPPEPALERFDGLQGELCRA